MTKQEKMLIQAIYSSGIRLFTLHLATNNQLFVATSGEGKCPKFDEDFDIEYLFADLEKLDKHDYINILDKSANRIQFEITSDGKDFYNTLT